MKPDGVILKQRLRPEARSLGGCGRLETLGAMNITVVWVRGGEEEKKMKHETEERMERASEEEMYKG